MLLVLVHSALIILEMPFAFGVALQSAFCGARTRAECDETIARIPIRDESSLRHGDRAVIVRAPLAAPNNSRHFSK